MKDTHQLKALKMILGKLKETVDTNSGALEIHVIRI